MKKHRSLLIKNMVTTVLSWSSQGEKVIIVKRWNVMAIKPFFPRR
jgi:hypothetical protein